MTRIRGAAEAGYLYVAGTVLLTVYGQLVVKWRVDEAGSLPSGFSDRASFLTGLLVEPWVISAGLGVVAAGLLWMVALTRIELSRAFPLLATTFVLVLGFSALLFGESLTAAKIVGVLFITLGLIIGTGR